MCIGDCSVGHSASEKYECLMMNVRGEREETSCGHLRSTASSSSRSSNTTADPNFAHPSTSRSTNMGGEQKLPSSSREMRNMAEKMRRDKLNYYISELAGIVPLGSGANKRIDKTSVLRLAANYIRMHKILRDDEEELGRIPQVLGSDITCNLLEAMGGFLLVVTSLGKVLYITEAVDQFFGHSQVDLLGHSIYSVIHPDDHEIFQQQLTQKENSRRSFFCRMMEKALSRNDPGRYEIIHVVGHLRPIPQSAGAVSSPCVLAPSPSGTNTSSDNDEDDELDIDGDCQALKVSLNRIGTHMLVSFVRVVKDRPITELSLVESTQDEYITRHGMNGKILYTDHRISFITGLMPTEVLGTSAFTYMHPDDMVWSIVAHKLMFTSTQGQGIVSYRLRCRDGSHVTLRSRGYLEVNKQTGQVDSFVCINTVLSVTEATSEIKNQRRKLLPLVVSQESDDHVSSISSTLPPELVTVLKQMINPETMQKMINSVDSFGENVESRNSEDLVFMPSDIPVQQYHNQKSSGILNKQEEGCKEANLFQDIPKRLQTFDALGSPYECLDNKSPELQRNRKIISDEGSVCGTSNKRTLADDSNIAVAKKFNYDNESYQTGSFQTQQYNSIISPHQCPPTSPLHREDENFPSDPGHYHDSTSFTLPKNLKNCVSGCYQQRNDHMISLGSHEQTRNVDMLLEGYSHDKSRDIHMPVNRDQNRNRVSPSPKTYNQTIRVNMQSPRTYDQSVRPDITSPLNYDHILSGNITSTDHCELGKSPPIISDSNQQTRIGNMPSSSIVQNRYGISIPSPGNYPQCSGSTGNFEQNRMNMTFSGSRKQNESYLINVPGSQQKYSSNVISPSCNYQPVEGNTITSTQDHSPSFSQNQFLPQYSQTSRVQSSQHPHQYQQQLVMEHPLSNTSLKHDLRLSSAPEFDIKLQRQQTVHNVGESETSHTSSLVNSSQCLPFGTTGISEIEGGLYRYPASSAALESGLSVQCSANFQLDSTHLSSETSLGHCQPSSVNPLQDHSITKDVSRQILSSRQFQHCHPHSQQGGDLL
ncbi:uncharacterized protein [Panulirus ornatus]|uniref:uncharacterized protein isoform X3 n=1 Tax=Panulirus ornatus TaxID=150431 RepID=UPI003A876CEC